MKVSKTTEGNFHLECSYEELATLSNALNNIPQAVDENEYTSLIGVTKAHVNKLLDVLVASLQENKA